MELKTVLRDLCLSHGVNGYGQAGEVARQLLATYTDDIRSDALGNVWGILPASDRQAPTVLLEAHIDEIGFVVTHTTDDGFLRVAACGGVDNRTLSAARVTVLTDPPCNGVFCSVPPHLSKEGDKLPELTDRAIDVGRANVGRVPVGTKVAFAPHFEELLGDRVSAKALDNRAGVAAILQALDMLKDKALPVNVVVAFCTQEELGLRGSKIASFSIQPDAALVVDVSFGYTPDAKKTECGELGKGVMLGMSPVLDAGMTESLRSLAEAHTIPLQFEVVGGATGTDADAMTVTAAGVPSVLLSIPLRYMHTPNEVVSLSDIEATARLIAAFVCEGEVPNHA